MEPLHEILRIHIHGELHARRGALGDPGFQRFEHGRAAARAQEDLKTPPSLDPLERRRSRAGEAKGRGSSAQRFADLRRGPLGAAAVRRGDEDRRQLREGRIEEGTPEGQLFAGESFRVVCRRADDRGMLRMESLDVYGPGQI